jgi:aminocarboxymuconate-semialdehyde decarboxylase
MTDPGGTGTAGRTPHGLPVVDMHAHFVPDAIIAAALDNRLWHGVSFGRTESGGIFSAAGGQRMALPWTLPLETAEARAEAMSAMGVDAQVVSLSPTMHWYPADPAEAPDFARAANDALVAFIARKPDRFIGLGYLPLQDTAAAIRELERCMGPLGLPGVMVGTNINGQDWDSPALYPVLEAAEALGAFVFFHPARGRADGWMARYHLRNLIGNPLETTATLAALIFGGVIERLPRLRACFAHGGGYGCFAIGRWDHGYHVRAEASAQISRLPSDYLSVLYFDSLTHSDRALRSLIDQVGISRILLGSDYPADMAAPDPVGAILGSPLFTPGERQAILSGNIRGAIGERHLTGLSCACGQHH